MSGIEESLGMRSLEDALRDQKAEYHVEEEEEEFDPFTLPEDFDRALTLKVDEHVKSHLGEKMLSGKETEDKLDVIYDTLMEHGETMARLAMELDPGKAPRAFEVMNGIIKNAMDAVNSKRDHELKTMKLLLEQKKLEMDQANSDQNRAGSSEAIVAVMTMADMVRGFRKAMDEAQVTETRADPTTK